MLGDLWVLVECCGPWLVIVPLVAVINLALWYVMRRVD